MLTELAEHEKVVGVKQVRRALGGGGAKTLYAARDADPALTGPLADLAQEKDIPVRWVDSMRALGRACGIAVGAAVAATV